MVDIFDDEPIGEIDPNAPVETQYEDYHMNKPLYANKGGKGRKLDDIGKELIGQWLNIRYTPNLEMQIQTEENGEWVTVVKFDRMVGNHSK